VYKTDKVPTYQTGGLGVRATDTDLVQTLSGSVAHGSFLNAATAQYPAAVLGASAARYLGITDVREPVQVLVGGRWFMVIGVLEPLALAPALDRDLFVGYPAAERYLGFDGQYTDVYLRTDPDQVADVQAVLARTANPKDPEEVAVSRPSDALAARAAAKGAYTTLFLGLGAVALLVGGVGIANVMFVSGLERRTEIGLRRALGATRGHIAIQFFTESVMLSLLGGTAGVAFGATATLVDAAINHWMAVVPPAAAAGGLASALVVGAAAGVYPALRAARLAPTEALRSV
jgi:putative ABC transport system permease protein